MNLVIVESPTKERTISKFLDKNFIVKSSYGHIRDLPEKELGIDIENNFAPRYEILPKAKTNIKILSSLSKKSSKIYLATDFDREGEAIAWHLTYALNLDKNKVYRITFHEITPEAIKQAINEPRDIDMSLVNSQQARRILDRLVGYKLSPLLWEKIQRGLSAGRVQSVAVRLICDREEEIKKFVPQEYWLVKVELKKPEISGTNFIADLISKEGKKYDKLDIKTKSDADQIINDISNKQFKVNKITKKEKKRHPPSPFLTATLQQESARILKFSPSKTMMIAQQLYEGINLGKMGQIGLITYMRTDSLNMAEVAINEIRKYINEKYGTNYLPDKPRRYKTKLKTAQEAHECIRPTSIYREPDKIKGYLSEDQYKLYKLIWTKTLACQMADAIYDTVTVDIEADKYLFRANGHTVKFASFLEISPESDDKKDVILPQMNENEILELVKPISEQHFTEPPPRYNESSLIKELEKNGIGRPSTYAPIIETILKRRYVKLTNHKFYPTELGIIVNNLLKQHFSEIVDTKFTATIEEKLDKIAQGKVQWTKIIEEFYRPFEKKLLNAHNNITKEKNIKETDEKCPKCGSVMYIRDGRFGKFLACSKYPECKSIISLDKDGNKILPEKLDEKCPKCGKVLVKRVGKRGAFIACSGFPKCRYIKSEETGEKCPKCGKELVKRVGKKGPFIACSGYPKCKFTKNIITEPQNNSGTDTQNEQ